MVFQSTIPIAVGLPFTDWELSRYAVLSGVLGLLGGVLAYWALRLRGRFEPIPIVIWSALFLAFIVYVAVPERGPAQRSASAASASSSCVFGETFGNTAARAPSASMTKVARWTPM